MCRVLKVNRSGFYAWSKTPISKRAKEDKRLYGLINNFWLDSDGIYGSPRIYLDLRESGETCGENRVAKIMRMNNIRALSHPRKPRFKSGTVSVVASNHLDREFSCTKPNQKWVTDITYLRTQEGFLYLAVVIDLFSRRVIGWSMSNSLRREIVIDALMMAVWRRQPKKTVLIHSDQGSQFGSDDCIRFCKAHNLKRSMSRKGNCWDNAVVESFFSALKRERIRKRNFKTREQARSEVFDYIEFFYNPKRRHDYLKGKSPVDFEKENIAI